MQAQPRYNKASQANGWRNIASKFRNLDMVVFWLVLALMTVGVVAVYSASADMAGSSLGKVFKQVVFDGVAMVTLLMAFNLNIQWNKSNGSAQRWFLWISLGLMVIAAFFQPINGAKGWISAGWISFQPVELFKITNVLWFARVLSLPKAKIFSLKNLAWPLLGLAILIIYPDFGGILINLGIMSIVILTSGLAPAMATVVILTSMGVIWYLLPLLAPFLREFGGYQIARFLAYINPWEYIQTSGGQVINSYYAISNGGLFGRGLGQSLQKNGNLPEPNTDFIMAVVGEEVGAIVVLLIVLAVFVIMYRFWRFGMQTRNMQYRMILFGMMTYLFMQVMVNLGGVDGALPITGVTFPFISAGGTSVVSLGLALGIGLNIIRLIKQEQQNQ
ncbi:MAG: FtsW/RodA/SpoVE family cell cycle protein [Lactobacillaceae bacterium]|jgi:cell division protein FtsW|nr:FtsW/RodA/SpoVE family cell cycle protein [Lactobacillaceae bacterium]